MPFWPGKGGQSHNELLAIPWVNLQLTVRVNLAIAYSASDLAQKSLHFDVRPLHWGV